MTTTSKTKVRINFIQAIELAILGIKNGKYDSAIYILEETIKQVKEYERNQASDDAEEHA